MNSEWRADAMPLIEFSERQTAKGRSTRSSSAATRKRWPRTQHNPRPLGLSQQRAVPDQGRHSRDVSVALQQRVLRAVDPSELPLPLHGRAQAQGLGESPGPPLPPGDSLPAAAGPLDQRSQHPCGAGARSVPRAPHPEHHGHAVREPGPHPALPRRRLPALNTSAHKSVHGQSTAVSAVGEQVCSLWPHAGVPSVGVPCWRQLGQCRCIKVFVVGAQKSVVLDHCAGQKHNQFPFAGLPRLRGVAYASGVYIANAGPAIKTAICFVLRWRGLRRVACKIIRQGSITSCCAACWADTEVDAGKAFCLGLANACATQRAEGSSTYQCLGTGFPRRQPCPSSGGWLAGTIPSSPSLNASSSSTA